MFLKTIMLIASVFYKINFKLYQVLYFNYKKNTDSSERRLISKILKKESNILDIGANIGFYTLYFSKIATNGKIHSFEPDVESYKHLQNSTQNKTNIILNNLAIADKTGVKKLYISKILSVDNRLYKFKESNRSAVVKITSVDDYIKNKFFVDLIKIDIQGSEYLALKGMENTILSNPDCVIIMEFWPGGLNQFGTKPETIMEIIKKMKLIVYKIDNHNLVLIDSYNKEKYQKFSLLQHENWLLCNIKNKYHFDKITY